MKNERQNVRIESLLSARLFLNPQRVGERLFFISNLSGHMSLYAMDWGGSVPEPLLPPQIALQNPALMQGKSFYVFPELNKILVMIDQDGDENYQPMAIPLEGGYPVAEFGDRFEGYRVHLGKCDRERNIAYLFSESRQESRNDTYRADLKTGELTLLGSSEWGYFVAGANDDHSQVILIESYTVGDHVLYRWTESGEELELLYGKPLEDRKEGEQVPLNAIYACEFTADDGGLIFMTALFEDTLGPAYLRFDAPSEIQPVAVSGVLHEGEGEMEYLEHLQGQRYLVGYNIDGATWSYEAVFDEPAMELRLDRVLTGQDELRDGVVQAHHYEKEADGYALSFSSATLPAQIYTIDGAERDKMQLHTSERILGIPQDWFSTGEDAAYDSHDGLRISARLYLPSSALAYEPPYPLVYYIHGGPQSQEKPDFTWFSMPLIQYLTLQGFAVFVPNVRGSTGYGLKYTKQVDRDWGGLDRLDHVHAMTVALPADKRVDVSRAGVVGRSYGGYMTLMLAGQHPELWRAAVDMFGPYDLFTFMDRLPETWKPYFRIAVGDPEKDKDFLIERSPKTYLHQLASPMLVIQGANDPRVVERESHDLVEELRGQGKQMDYLMFENEGHDVLKFENRVRCYNAIAEFFHQHLVVEG